VREKQHEAEHAERLHSSGLYHLLRT
jgi:hypothetical protein